MNWLPEILRWRRFLHGDSVLEMSPKYLFAEISRYCRDEHSPKDGTETVKLFEEMSKWRRLM